MENFIRSLKDSLHKGFIDHTKINQGKYPPKLLINNIEKNENVLGSLIEELEKCESFIFSVAFITESGLAALKSHLWDLRQKGIKGRLLTSTFLSFNQPKMFRELLKIENVEVRLTDMKGFHSKGYIFKHRTHYSLIVGSSNLTASALKVNYEWNVKLTSHKNGEFIHHFREQFEGVWAKSQVLTEQWIKKYEENYVPLINSKVIHQIKDPGISYAGNAIEDAMKIVPNKMQEAALEQIHQVRAQGQNKGLVISATGTGKTYLSAFDVRRFRPKRMLFIVHREQILTKAKEDYRKILGGVEEDFGLFSGTSRDQNTKYLFATIQSISRDNHLCRFEKDEFDYVLIDEVHKAGAESYKRVMEYFTPKFMMGMTATPERTDGFNIYELFDYNIAYEIRLQEALEEEMLCPFHYFGVTDFELDGQLIDDTAILSQLVTEERVQHIIDKVSYYGFSGDEVRGLIFCSRKAEAKELSKALNEKGFNTAALTGNDSQQVREQRVNQLESGSLDYIVTVDIFNEGIDIPSVNQVIMLRQTQSSIIFIQQLGRGLRKHQTKEFVTIIDFIGNYKNNYLIPTALSGDKSMNKDNTRRHTKDTSYIKGVSTVNFEEVAKKQIYKSINDSKLTSLKVLRDAYIELKNKLGRIPKLMDYITYHSIDPNVIINEYNSYYQFLLKIGEELPVLDKYESQVLSMLSIEFLNGKRRHEPLLLEQLVNQSSIHIKDYQQLLQKNNCIVDEATLKSIIRIFDLSFFTQSDQKKYGEKPIVITENQTYKLNTHMQSSLQENHYFKEYIEDVIQTALTFSKDYPSNEPLKLYGKYSRKDVCRVLNWENDEKGTMYGYKTKHGTCPVFVTYHKDEDVESSVAYEDEFISPEILKMFSKNSRTLNSAELQPIIYSEDNNVDIHVFVKKDDAEGRDFYYLGKAVVDRNSLEQTTIPTASGDRPIVKMNLLMEYPIKHNMYHYLTSK
ncbi:Superfamily II DNA or RNA helicase [Evansella caseinilytica]|uniref:Superfamily II DNA or RNA helicase n=1 Tax=Evansella caseinilytica TaxID=1503961 RepID=A0A1H3U3T4_9BACI|nr:DEAD/DEAH box helicase [Evansella caseinilytica]SDZ56741.1 Superfamily II DNA or RNA helicase [Evansella caseinilytica]